jgi:hypothetical protein
MKLRPGQAYQPDLLNPRGHPRGHENCRHNEYALSCHYYNILLRRANGMCEICLLPGLHNVRHNKLYIDHDYKHGNWAVRGLLCSECNTKLGRFWREDFRDQDYLEKPFYLQVLKECDSPLYLDEPPVGSKVLDFYGGAWIRHKASWRRPGTGFRPKERIVSDWARLHRENGPHVLRSRMVLPPPPEAPPTPESIVAGLRRKHDEATLTEVIRLLTGGQA